MSVNELRDALKVYFIMGSSNCQNKPSEVLSEAIVGGITCFQFREKSKDTLSGKEKYALAEELQFLCRQAKIPFIVNDDIDLALAINADGVHIGQEDEPALMVKEKIKDKILGVSVHNFEEATMAMKAGADYFGVGPIFPTKTKADAKEVQGVKIIQELRAKGMMIPIVGIGGITSKNAAIVIEGGADGVSVISAISQDENPQKAAATLKEKVMLTS
ncbi:thiamine phosphate synthase [Bacillus sp. V3B]|uniref:thiamine phosphate synthase n=1 Tax=Bacillus sp. V3B TaxID=2804915 RepID=UPI0035C71BAA